MLLFSCLLGYSFFYDFVTKIVRLQNFCNLKILLPQVTKKIEAVTKSKISL